MLERWLGRPFFLDDLAGSGLEKTADEIHRDNTMYLAGSLELAGEVFGRWLDQLETPAKRVVLGSR